MLNELRPTAGPTPSAKKPPKHLKRANETAERLPEINSRTPSKHVDDKIKPKSFVMQSTASALMQQPTTRQRSDSISELDLQSVKHARDDVGRGQPDLASSTHRKANGSGLLPEIGAGARHNNLFDPNATVDQAQMSSGGRHRLGHSVNPHEQMETQSLRSSESGFRGLAEDDQQSTSIYSRHSKNFNPFYPKAPSSGKPPAGPPGGFSSKASVAKLHQQQVEEKRKL